MAMRKRRTHTPRRSILANEGQEAKVLSSIFEAAQVPACGNYLLMPHEAPSERLVGMEFECCGISIMGAEQLLQRISTRDWAVHEDGSLPQMEEDCESCNGSGSCEIDCDYCYGRGQRDVRCEECRGNGRCINPDPQPDEEEAPEAYAEWEQYIDCPDCDGEGTVEDDCPDCCGEGTTSDECSTCGGSGRSQESSGAEIVSPPGKTEEFFSMCKRILRALDREGAYAAQEEDSNHCTGLHIHVDARDLSKSQCAAIVCLAEYHLRNGWPDEFPGILPTWRYEDRGHYWARRCKPEYSNSLLKFYEDNTFERYRATNLCSLAKHQTIEFRIGYMHFGGEEVVRWAKTLRALVDTVAQLGEIEGNPSEVCAMGLDGLNYGDAPREAVSEAMPEVYVTSQMEAAWRRTYGEDPQTTLYAWRQNAWREIDRAWEWRWYPDRNSWAPRCDCTSCVCSIQAVLEEYRAHVALMAQQERQVA